MLPDGKDLPVLIDFGVGKQIADMNEGRSSNHQVTFVGKMSLVGKVGYAPREQISLGLCSPSSDLYALGVTAIVLLTGRDPSLLMDQYSLEWNWRYYTYVTDGFAQVLDQMLADRPNKRYQTAREVLIDLERIGEPEVVMSRAIMLDDLPPTVFNPEFKAMSAISPSYNQPGETIFSSPTSPAIPQNGRIKEQQPSLQRAFLKRCQQELAYHIGPMANLVIEEILAENPYISPDQFIELIVREIPDFKAAFEFKKSLFS
jgi:serine/threonine-protein kinase